MPYIEIDNPGKGDCAFYSVAIALVDNIKRQDQRSDTSLFHAWSPFLEDVSQQELLTIDLLNQGKHLALLQTLQASLRDVLVAKRTEELRIGADNLSGLATFNDYAAIFYNASAGRATSKSFNRLAGSKPLINSINAEAKRYSDFSRGLSNTNDYPEAELIQWAFRRDVYSYDDTTDEFKMDNGRAELNPNSQVVKALKGVLRPLSWGTHTDLGELAEYFNVELLTLHNGRNQLNQLQEANKPQVIVNNKHKLHWTTQLSFVGSNFQGKTYQKFYKDSVITKAEIKEIFESYTQGFMASVTTRHHRAQAQLIINNCQDTTVSLKLVLAQISYYTKDVPNFTANSSFKKRADYILARADFCGLSPQLS